MVQSKHTSLNVRVLGVVEASSAGVQFQITSRKATALLAILTLEQGQNMSRERLRGLLWSDYEETRAQNSLRQAIHTLGKTVFKDIRDDYLISTKLTIGLRESSIRCDALDILKSVTEPVIDPRLLNNPKILKSLMAEHEGLDELLDDWITEQREFLINIVSRRIEQLLNQSAPQFDRSDHAQVLLGLEPLNETACRFLMSEKATSGDTAMALTLYQGLWNRVDEEFGEEPSAATQDLAVAIKRGEICRAPGQTGQIWIDSNLPVIYVRPIEIEKSNGMLTRISNGFRHDLVAALVRFREWRVFDLNPEDAVDEKLGNGARYVIELSLWSEAAEVSAALTFRDYSTGQYVWSHRFGNLAQTWRSQQELLVQRLATSLNIHQSVDRFYKSLLQDQFSLTGYDAWLQGQELMMQHTPESWEQAERTFDQIIATNPSFARGYSSRAGIENMRHIAFPGFERNAESRITALNYSRKAIALDPIDSRTQLAHGWSCAMNAEFDQAELAYELAYQHNENDPWTMISSAVGLGFCDRVDTALALIKRVEATGFEPNSVHWSFLAATHFLIGDYESCIVASTCAEEITADVPAWHAAALANLGRTEEARKVGRIFVEHARKHWMGEKANLSEGAISSWLLKCFPIRSNSTWRALKNGLIDAGVAASPENHVSDILPPLRQSTSP